MNCIKVEEEPEQYLHIPGVINTIQTLCGWVDVNANDIVGVPDCPNCLKIVRYCKGLRIRRKTLQ